MAASKMAWFQILARANNRLFDPVFFFLDRCFSSPELRERVRLSVGFPASWSEQLQVDKKNDLKFMRMRQYPLKVGREFSWNRDVTKKVYWERLQTTNTYKLRKEKRYFMTLTMASGNMLRTFDNSRIPSSTDADTAETKKQNWASSEQSKTWLESYTKRWLKNISLKGQATPTKSWTTTWTVYCLNFAWKQISHPVQIKSAPLTDKYFKYQGSIARVSSYAGPCVTPTKINNTMTIFIRKHNNYFVELTACFDKILILRAGEKRILELPEINSQQSSNSINIFPMIKPC